METLSHISQQLERGTLNDTNEGRDSNQAGTFCSQQLLGILCLMMKDEEKLQQQRATDQTLKGRREEGPKNETGEQQESLKAPHNHIG